VKNALRLLFFSPFTLSQERLGYGDGARSRQSGVHFQLATSRIAVGKAGGAHHNLDMCTHIHTPDTHTYIHLKQTHTHAPHPHQHTNTGSYIHGKWLTKFIKVDVHTRGQPVFTNFYSIKSTPPNYLDTPTIYIIVLPHPLPHTVSLPHTPNSSLHPKVNHFN